MTRHMAVTPFPGAHEPTGEVVKLDRAKRASLYLAKLSDKKLRLLYNMAWASRAVITVRGAQITRAEVQAELARRALRESTT